MLVGAYTQHAYDVRVRNIDGLKFLSNQKSKIWKGFLSFGKSPSMLTFSMVSVNVHA